MRLPLFQKKPAPTPASVPPVFLLGVGAQKAATTWLFRYLNDHPQCVIGPIKEQSVLQSVYQPDRFRLSETVKMRGVVALLETAIRQAQADESADQRANLLAHLDNLAMNLAPERYWTFYHDLMVQHPQARLFGDITPEYAGLSADDFRDIRRRIVEAGFTPRVVFLMRDPIERCFSMMRMADRNTTTAGNPVDHPAHIRFESAAKSDWCQMYTRYERTIGALEQVFGPDELFYGFYETFLTVEELSRCCQFLSIDLRPARFQSKVNWSPRDADIDADAVKNIRAFYDDTYAFCKTRFGADMINRIWQNA